MNTSKTASGFTIDPSILRQAKITWRRAAVRRTDRREMGDELSNELTAAAEAGLPPSAVTGDDVAATMRAWADERGMTGCAGRYAAIVPATLVGVAVGMGLLFAVLYVGFDSGIVIEPYLLVFGIYLVSGALAYLMALAGAWSALTVLGDPRRSETVTSLAFLLPVAALAAIAIGVAIAWSMGFTTSIPTYVAVIAGVCAVLAAAIAFARFRILACRGE
ncbi:hypothetical protein EV641_1094 [Rhodococcus sp. SMB37]|uniref:hypothetical protein n=1 Tax=Rhodococcus sp. SMB37 TaxID=2512213 RepID=UPI00104E3B56|nr:hypothetical protein [Rhodococcus sp. SMB37]TCN51617.1 hypothetical protein EV641_1094 [Rhodococcus sp. SMB37]